MSNMIQIRRGLEEHLPTLSVGELGFAVDTTSLWVGTPLGNAMMSKSLDAFIAEYTGFQDEVVVLVEELRALAGSLESEALIARIEALEAKTSSL